jgi:hypothetical protein
VQHEKTEKKKKRHCKFTLAKFLAPGPSKGMKVNINKEKFSLRMDYIHTQPLSILFFGQRGGGGVEAVQ